MFVWLGCKKTTIRIYWFWVNYMNSHESTNRKKAIDLQDEYQKWKFESLETVGFFPIFSNFEDELLREISGNTLKLYIFLGIRSKNRTGECWVSLETLASYFGKSKRTISGWMEELVRLRLVSRIQFEKNGVSFTFLRPYNSVNKE